MATKWYIDPSTGDLYFPNGNHAADLGDTETPIKDAKEWTLNIVSSVGLKNLTDEQMIWLLAMTMDQYVIGPPPSLQ